MKPRPKKPRYATEARIVGPIEHAEFVRAVERGEIDPALAIKLSDGRRAVELLPDGTDGAALGTNPPGFDSLMKAARHSPALRRRIVAELRTMGLPAGRKLPPTDVEIAAVWSAFRDHHRGRVTTTATPSKNAALAPIAKRLAMPKARVRTILYDHEPGSVSRNMEVAGKKLRR